MKQGWIKNEFGTKHHYVDDEIHNDNGPAIIFTDGSKIWYKHGKIHREDGPAIERHDGSVLWFYYDKLIGKSIDGFTQQHFNKWKRIQIFT